MKMRKKRPRNRFCINWTFVSGNGHLNAVLKDGWTTNGIRYIGLLLERIMNPNLAHSLITALLVSHFDPTLAQSLKTKGRRPDNQRDVPTISNLE